MGDKGGQVLVSKCDRSGNSRSAFSPEEMTEAGESSALTPRPYCNIITNQYAILGGQREDSVILVGGPQHIAQYNKEGLVLMLGKLIWGHRTISQCSPDKRPRNFISSCLAWKDIGIPVA